MAQIQLDYFAEIPPTMSDADFDALVAAADITTEGELDFLSMTVNSSTTTVLATEVRRRIVLDTDATSDANFPTDAAKKYATKNLYTIALATKIPAKVRASDPVVL